MKKQFFYSFTLTLIFSMMIYSCDKENLTGKLFGGNASWSGSVMYKNVYTGITDTARGAVIQIIKSNLNTSDSMFETVSPKGIFSIPYLTAGHYTAKVSYHKTSTDSVPTSYSYKGSFDLRSDSRLTENILLLVDSGQTSVALKLFGKAEIINLETSFMNDAANAEVSLFQTAISTNVPIKTTKTDNEGNYSFSNLPRGHYRLECRYSYPATFGNHFDLSYLNISYFQLKPWQSFKQDLVLKWDSANTNDVFFKLLIVDSTGHKLRKARVCLYGNMNYLNANAPGCNGSLASDVTNDNGVVIFNNLQKKFYYFNVRDTVGVIPLSNEHTTQSTSMALKMHCSNNKTVTLKE